MFQQIFKKTALLIFIVFSIGGTSVLSAQVDPVGDFTRHIVESWKGQSIRIGAYTVKGSPYLMSAAHTGNITYRGGQVVKNTKILYDIYLQKAGIEKNNEIFEANEPIETFSLKMPEVAGGQVLQFRNSYLYGKPELKSFFNVLEEGEKVVLLKMFKLRLVADPVNNMDTKMKVFEPYYDYYLYDKKTENLTRFSFKKKELVKVLGNERFVSAYVSADDFDISKESQIVALVHAFNND